MRKTASSRDLFAKLEDELKKKPIKGGKRAAGGRSPGRAEDAYTAADIEVLEGLEPVRRRPGMYIGGTDEKAMHHLFAEVLDNAMDEAVAGHATRIEVELEADGFLTVTDNGRGIPVDPHPKFKKKSALEVIMTTLHSGGKFNSKVYETSGGLHGVGVSVANALSETHRGRGGARPEALSPDLYARHTRRPAEEPRRGEEPPRHQGPLQARPQDLRQGRGLQAGAAVPHGALEGLSVPRRRDPLVLRQGRCLPATARRRRAPSSTSPAGSRIFLPAASRGRRPSPTTSSPAASRGPKAMARSNGRSPGSPATTAS